MTDATPAQAQDLPAALGNLADLLAALQPAAQRTAPVLVPMPELGAPLYVAQLGTAEWLDPDANVKLPEGFSPAHKRAWSVARWVTDAAGNRLVSPDNLQALDLFAALPWAASHRILVAAGVVHEDAEKNG